jgi:hypothetical protein
MVLSTYLHSSKLTIVKNRAKKKEGDKQICGSPSIYNIIPDPWLLQLLIGIAFTDLLHLFMFVVPFKCK